MFILMLAGCGAAGSPSTGARPSSDGGSARELLEPTEFGYSNAARFGDLVWTAGHLPLGVEPDARFEDQVQQALDNLEQTLSAADAGFDTVLQANVYLLDFADWEAFNDIYVARVGADGLPARTTVEVSELGLGYRIEIQFVAHRRSSP